MQALFIQAYALLQLKYTAFFLYSKRICTFSLLRPFVHRMAVDFVHTLLGQGYLLSVSNLHAS